MERDEGELARRLAEQAAAQGKDDDGSAETYEVRRDAARDREADDISGVESVTATEEDPQPQLVRDAGRDPFDPLGMERPPDMRETVDVAATAPDGTAIPERGTFTSPMGESIGGNSVSDSVTSRADDFGHGALGERGIGGVDFDP